MKGTFGTFSMRDLISALGISQEQWEAGFDIKYDPPREVCLPTDVVGIRVRVLVSGVARVIEPPTLDVWYTPIEPVYAN